MSVRTTTAPLATLPAATSPAQTSPTVTRPSAGRRAALAATGLPACALPAVFATSITALLVTQTDTDHRFHQLTGQGLVLIALWFGGLVPLLRAGWSGRRPPASAAWLHLAFGLVGAAAAVAAPGGGAPFLLAVVLGTGAAVWLALPVKPRLAVRPLRLDPVLAPVALLAAAFYSPFALDQFAQQNRAVGYHAANPHLFDMAWMALVLVAAAVVASLVEPARGLVRWTAAGSLTLGLAGLACGEPTLWSATALGLGVLAAAATWFRGRLDGNR